MARVVATQPAVGALRLIVAVLMACAFVLLVLVVALGFEEPHPTMLLASAGFIATAIAAVFLHVRSTTLLTGPEKRAWVSLLLGRRAPVAWSEYLTSSNLAASAERLSTGPTPTTRP